MSLLETLVLAVVQGLTEFLPISSTAHLVLVPWLLEWNDPGLTFDVTLHAGTLVAVLVYFSREWVRLVRAALVRLKLALSLEPAVRGNDAGANPSLLASDVQLNITLLQVLVVATLPAAVVGYWLEDHAESAFRNPLLIAATLVGISFVMWVADRRRSLVRSAESIRFADALVVGVAQAVAIIPGTSRAGITISAGLFRNLTREAAARFSFMLATPIIAGATAKKGLEVWQEGLPAGYSPVDYIVGFLVSAAVGYAAIAFLLRYLQVRTLKIFVAYRLALGGIIIAVELLRSHP